MFARIPVAIIAKDPAESQAFADVFTASQTGALALAEAGERPAVTLICPSGDASQIAGPTVVLGPRKDISESCRVLEMPIPLADILRTLEAAATDTTTDTGPKTHGGWRLDPSRLNLTDPGGNTHTLTDTERRLLICLFEARGEEVERPVLLQRVWGYRPGLDTHTVETHIYRLRQKIETDPANPSFVLTSTKGYRLP